MSIKEIFLYRLKKKGKKRKSLCFQLILVQFQVEFMDPLLADPHLANWDAWHLLYYNNFKNIFPFCRRTNDLLVIHPFLTTLDFITLKTQTTIPDNKDTTFINHKYPQQSPHDIGRISVPLKHGPVIHENPRGVLSVSLMITCLRFILWFQRLHVGFIIGKHPVEEDILSAESLHLF